MSAPTMCPLCGSENIENDDPRPGIAYSCRECGSWFHEVVDGDAMAHRAWMDGES